MLKSKSYSQANQSNHARLIKFDSGKKSCWPLPPSSVFRCKPATPWIDPELFYVDHSFSPLQVCPAGVVVVGDFIPDISENGELSSNIYKEFGSTTYPPPVIYSLPKIRIEYSDNPERGIDLGNELADDGRQRKPKKLVETPYKRVGWVDAGGDKAYKLNHSKVSPQKVSRSDSRTQKKKKWSPFQKDQDQTQSWKLFY